MTTRFLFRHSAVTLTKGNPGCSIQVDASFATERPLLLSNALQRLMAFAFENWFSFKYKRIPSRNASSPRNPSSMRMKYCPFQEVISSKASKASSSPLIGCWIGCVFSCASWNIARSRSSQARSHPCHCGYKCSSAFRSIQVAKLSLSQRLSHQATVTRSPNHWCATSWARTVRACS